MVNAVRPKEHKCNVGGDKIYHLANVIIVYIANTNITDTNYQNNIFQ